MDDFTDDDLATAPNGQGDWPSWTPFEYFEIGHKNGNPRALMEALLKCSLLNLPMPDWVAEAYQESYRKVTTFQVRSWDDAFGSRHPKGTDLKASRKKLALGGKIFALAREMIEAGRPTDLGLFEDVGEQFNVSGSYARDAYYEHLDRLKETENSIANLRLMEALKNSFAKEWREFIPDKASRGRSTYKDKDSE